MLIYTSCPQLWELQQACKRLPQGLASCKGQGHMLGDGIEPLHDYGWGEMALQQLLQGARTVTPSYSLGTLSSPGAMT